MCMCMYTSRAHTQIFAYNAKLDSQELQIWLLLALYLFTSISIVVLSVGICITSQYSTQKNTNWNTNNFSKEASVVTNTS